MTTLANFNGTNGTYPSAGLALGPDGNFYGTASFGGSKEFGTVFKVTTNGTLRTLVNFYDYNGYNPLASLTLGPDGNFYGTTSSGGSGDGGTVFKVTTNGTLTTLVNFDNSKGGLPSASLTLGPDGNFYGTTEIGGSSSDGTVFKVTTNGMLTTLVNFNGTNGADPQAGLTLGPDGNFYGTTSAGGSGAGGTIFQLELPRDFILGLANQSVIIGDRAIFNCQVLGATPLGYQWLFNGVPIDGATNTSLTISPALTNEIGNYQLVVTNGNGSVTSSVATLNVVLEPNIYAISNGGGGNCTVYLGSFPNSTNRLWATTNLALDQFQVIATNITDSNGLAQFIDASASGVPQKFYRLSYP